MKSQLNKIYIIIFIILFFTLSKSNAIEDVKEFTDAINFFKTLSVDDMNKRYLKAYQQLNIKIY